MPCVASQNCTSSDNVPVALTTPRFLDTVCVAMWIWAAGALVQRTVAAVRKKLKIEESVGVFHGFVLMGLCRGDSCLELVLVKWTKTVEQNPDV